MKIGMQVNEESRTFNPKPFVKFKGNVMLENGKESLSIPSEKKRKAIRAKRKNKR